MIEQKIEALTAAIIGLTAAITASGGATAAITASGGATAAAPVTPTKPAKTEKPAAAAKAKHSKAEMQAAVNEVKENFDTATAKALIKAAGFDKLGDVTEDKFDELYDAAKAKMGELGGESGDGL